LPHAFFGLNIDRETKYQPEKDWYKEPTNPICLRRIIPHFGTPGKNGINTRNMKKNVHPRAMGDHRKEQPPVSSRPALA
jgi:hypothetical protein